MSSQHSGIILSSLAGVFTGVCIAYSVEHLERRRITAAHFVKDPSSPFPIHPDELDIMVHGFKMTCASNFMNGIKKCIFVPTHWNFADMELRALRNMRPDLFNTTVLSVCLLGHDFIACKGSLARLSRKYLTDEAYQNYLPASWPVETWLDLHTQIQQKKVDPDSLFIVKTNLQRQTSTFIYRAQDLPLPDDLKREQAVVIQSLLSNPLCVDERKVTLRVYVLCFVSRSQRRMWRFSNGFVYYSNSSYKDRSDELDSQIASGYGDRDVYETRPLTLHDLWKSFSGAISWRYSHDIDACLKATIGNLLQQKDIIEDIPQGSYQIFGCDIFLKDYDKCSSTSQSLAMLLEVNKAPDLTYKSYKDGALKRSLMRKMWLLVSRPDLLDIPRSENLLDDLDEDEIEDTWLSLI